ncbi:unnamed protein product (macronuclear) [Paramecium tetraurelia]|uniref:EF-hand domain-containing protein n=1 Tax=Paramecium tetraurelia TaxID=5888 RepID=A0D8Q3_PARTE|nr:uncharacterized protein GSPATT00014366001 [Paramecium tetraurelia]CAK79420.1 unnamed protein product [Paramecium tetraurelia]|eukprot:XP_001446817.1 hypothetical protein (macronuclear) [Paramecium tetraurelia strain d4-2]
MQQELQQIKVENNKLINENTKLKTQIILFDKDLVRYEKLCVGSLNKSSDLLLIQLRKHNKELSQQLKEKIDQIEHLKRSAKITRIAELECENKVQIEEYAKLKSCYENAIKQINDLNQKLQWFQNLQVDIQKLQRLNENNVNENKNLNTKITQLEEMLKQQQILNKTSIQQHEKKINTLQAQNKKLISEKTNLKVTIKMLQDREKAFVILKKPSSHLKLSALHQLILTELKFKLILRGITVKQLNEMFDGLKQQAKEQNVQIRLDDFHHILSQEPFSFTDNKKILQILNCLTGNGDVLIEQFLNLIGIYETFNNFDFEQEQQTMQEQLNQNKQKIKEYWNQKQVVDYHDVQKMVLSVGLSFNNSSLLYYNLNLFEKSNEDLQNIKVSDTLDPFLDEDQEILEFNSYKKQTNQPPRISEVSDEEHYEQQD